MELAYAQPPKEYRNCMVLETRCNTLGNAYLQNHLLAVDVHTHTLEDAIRYVSQ